MKRKINRKRRILFVISMFFLLSFTMAFAQEQTVLDFTPASPDAFAVILQFYQYDSTIPLDAKIVHEPSYSKQSRQKIVFTGVNDKRVPGYLELPKSGNTPFPCILLIHGLSGSKEDWWNMDSTYGELTQSLLKSGFAVAALDAEYHGERIEDNNYESPDQMILVHGWYNRYRDMILHSVLDYRRMLDYLGKRPDIDNARIGVLGYSMGGELAFLLTAVDTRIKAIVSCVGPPRAKTAGDASGIPLSKRSLLSATDAHNFAYAIGSRPFLMMMGKQDNLYTEEEVNQLFNLIPSPTKDLVWFDSGHMLPVEWVPKAASWFKTYLK